MTKKQPRERGQASILIELEDGNITVRHGKEHVVLHVSENVPAGSWDKLWDVIKSL